MSVNLGMLLVLVEIILILTGFSCFAPVIIPIRNRLREDGVVSEAAVVSL